MRWMEHWWWGRGWPSRALGAARKLGRRSTATGRGGETGVQSSKEPCSLVLVCPPAGMVEEAAPGTYR